MAQNRSSAVAPASAATDTSILALARFSAPAATEARSAASPATRPQTRGRRSGWSGSRGPWRLRGRHRPAPASDTLGGRRRDRSRAPPGSSASPSASEKCAWVKPFVLRNTTDAGDATAIRAVLGRPDMRLASIHENAARSREHTRAFLIRHGRVGITVGAPTTRPELAQVGLRAPPVPARPQRARKHFEIRPLA
jgi:hypothetical protein